MKVLYIWHAAVVREYRKKIHAIAKLPNVDVSLLVPPAWCEGGRFVSYEYDPQIDYSFTTRIGTVLHKNNIKRYYFLNKLFFLLKNFQPDIVDIEEEPFARVTAQTAAYKKIARSKAKLIFHTSHNIKRPLENRFERIRARVFREFDAGIFRNKDAEIILRENGFAKPLYFVGNGFDLGNFSLGQSEQLRANLNFQNKFVIGFVGKLKTGKGILDLLDAFLELPQNIVLLIVGQGHLRNELEKRIASANLEKRVFLAGTVEHSEIPEYYRAMDVCVVPSRTEGGWKESFGRTIIEAMACGVPVIGSSSGAIPETINSAGLIFRERDSGDMAEKIGELYKSNSLQAELRNKGLERARIFSWETIARAHLKIYQDVLGE